MTGTLQQEQAKLEHQRRAERKALSQSRYKNWPNTLEAQRQKKDLDRQRRLDEIEAMQQAIDERERQFRDQEKRQAIARANILLYQENDRVKTFRSSMLASQVLQERANQSRFKIEKQKHIEAMERKHEQQVQAAVKAMEEREQREVDARAKLAAQVAQVRSEQLRQKALAYAEQRRADIAEGEAIRQAAILALEEDKQTEEQLRAQQREHAMNYLRANEEQRKLKKELDSIEAIEEERIKAYAARKEELEAIRRKTEEERLRKKLEEHQRLIERQQALLEKIKREQQEKIERDMAAMEKKREEAEKAEIDYRARLQEDLQRGREMQIQRQARDVAIRREIDKMMAQEWQRLNEQQEQQEKEHEEKTREAAKQLQQEHIAQMEERHLREARARAEQLAAARRAQRAHEHDDQIFKAYAEHHIKEYESAGRPTETMKITLRKLLKPVSL